MEQALWLIAGLIIGFLGAALLVYVALSRQSRKQEQRLIQNYRFHHDSMGRKRSEPNASADHRSDACAIGSPCDGCPAGR